MTESQRQQHVDELMRARRAVRTALERKESATLKAARGAVQAAKVALGERGPVWCHDGAPDLNRHMARNTPYAAWHAGLDAG